MKHIPNIITLGNLFCGLMSIMFAFSEFPWMGAYFIFGGLFLDFFDGFFARVLKVDGDLGKQLDSLADLVTFGVAPGFLMFKLLELLVVRLELPEGANYNFYLIPFLAFIIPILSAIRLAKFNISTNQSDQFIGLPTPGNAIFFASIIILFKSYIIDAHQTINTSVLIALLSGLIVLFSLLLNAEIPLIALKFKTFGWQGNEVRFIFVGLCLVTILLSLLISNVFVAVPIIILLYLIISIINNITKRKNEVQSKH